MGRSTQGVPLRVAVAIERQLIWLVLLAVVAGILVPRVPAADLVVLPALFVLVAGAVATADPAMFRLVSAWRTGLVLVAGLVTPFVLWGLGVAVGLSGAVLLGLVVFAVAPPELTTPLLTRVSGGDVAFSTVLLVSGALASVVAVPVAVAWLDVGVAPVGLLVASVIVGVLLPTALALAARIAWPGFVAPREALWSGVSALMLVPLMFVVAQGAWPVLRDEPTVALRVALVGGVVLIGMAVIGFRVVGGGKRGRAAGLALGVRDFAVAAALLVAIGAPPGATVAPAVLGLGELVVGAWWAARVGRSVTNPAGDG